MHIAIIVGPFLPVPPVLGGAVEKVHWALARAYRTAGHRVTIVCREHEGLARREAIDGIDVIRVPSFRRSRHLPINLWRGLRYSLRAARVLPAADVTICNETFLPLILPRRRAGKIYAQVGRYPKHQMLLYSRADRVQAVSCAVGDAIARQAPWLARRVAVIGYAISDSYFTAPTPDRERVVLYVGRLAREKGIELLIGAFARLPSPLRAEWRLRVIGPHDIAQGGDGAGYRAALQQRARPLGERCTFAGAVFDEAELAREYRAASIFVYPSLAEHGESFGVAPLEAMAGGCAVVVSDLACFDDYLQAGVTGLRFDHRGPAAEEKLAECLLRLMSDPEQLARITEAGRHVAEGFRTAPIAARMLADFAVVVRGDR